MDRIPDRTMRELLALLLLLWISADTPAAAAGGDCPANSIAFNSVPVSSTAGSRDTSFVGDCSSGRARYDLVTGYLAVEVLDPCGPELIEVDTADEFVVLGLALGTPVELTAVLDASGGGWPLVPELPYSVGSGSASISDGTASDSEQAANGSFSRPLSLGLHVSVGQPFVLHLRVTASADLGGGSAQGQLRFTGIPPGCTVSSCQGYQFGPVPVRKTTWGSLKARFR